MKTKKEKAALIGTAPSQRINYACEGTENQRDTQEMEANIFDTALEDSDRNAADNGLRLSTEGFSKHMKKIIDAFAETFQSDRNAIITEVLTAAGAAAGKRVRVHDGKYVNNVALYSLVVAPSGCNKSAPLKEILRPLRQRNSQAYMEWKEAVEAWQAVPDNTVPRPQLDGQVLLSDTTPEALFHALSIAKNGLLLYGDEASTVLNSFDRYAKGSGASCLLSFFDSTSLVINRKSGDNLLIEDPHLSLLATTQPSVLPAVFSRQMIDAGLPQRFLFAYQAEQTMTPYCDTSLNEEVREDWLALIGSIYQQPPRDLYINGVAKQVYVDFFNALQEKKLSASPFMASSYSKLQIIVERIAAIIHVLNEHISDQISADEMAAAVSMARYYERTAKLVETDLIGDAQPISKGQLIRQVWNTFDCLSQSGLAAAIGVSQPYIAKVIKGKGGVK